ncbi:patatin-like phospholipase family protein [Lentibacillus sediminis]|uniref:patatin-like phospholipase family protein n=1 Tax=Lentibacillus sediminis TaxID=1940529 RepID=UPI001EFC7018|nr:patatin family protein [Lentibacillus sediminis]
MEVLEDNIGLVLEGGGMRGAYTAGVLDFFHDKGIQFPLVTSASSAAIIGSSYIAMQRGRNHQILTELGKRRDAISFMRMLKQRELFSMDFIFDKLPNELIPLDFDAFSKSPATFFIGTTDLKSGQTVYHQSFETKQDLLQLIRASCSLPVLAPSIPFQGNELMDGGIGEAIPLKPSVESGNKKHVVVLTRDKGYIKKPTRLNWLFKRTFKQHPQFADLLRTRHELYNKTMLELRQLEKKGKVFIIQPEHPLTASRIERNGDKLQQLYLQGYQDAEKKHTALIQFLEPSKEPYLEENIPS